MQNTGNKQKTKRKCPKADDGKKAKKARIETADENNNVIGPPLSLLDLNDDCLIEILGYFDVIELYRLAKVCDRFNNIIKIDIMRDRTLCLNQMTEIYSIPKVLKNLGSNVRTLVASKEDIQFKPKNQSSSQQLLYLINKYCHSLLHLDIEMDLDQIPAEWIENNAGFLINLKTIKIESRRDSTDVSNFLRFIRNVEKIDFSYCRLRSTEMPTFANLSSLKLYNCILSMDLLESLMKKVGKKLKVFEHLNRTSYSAGFKLERLMAIINEHNTNLTELGLTISHDITSQTFENFEQLEKLKIVSWTDFDAMHKFLSNFSHVKHLSIVDNHSYITSTDQITKIFKNLKTLELRISKFGQKKFQGQCIPPNIEELKLIGFNLSHTDIMFLLNSASHTFRSLDISKSQVVFSKPLYKKIINFVKSGKFKLPITIEVGAKCLRYLENYNANILKVV